MHTYVHFGPVYNSKDLKPTQVPINDRLDKENMAHIHHGVLCTHKKWWVHILCRDTDESGNHNSQQTDTRTENQPPHVLTHSRVLNNENHGHREQSITHWGLLRGRLGEGRWEGEVGRDSLGRNAKCGWRGEEKQSTLPCVYLRKCLACSAHVPQNL